MHRVTLIMIGAVGLLTLSATAMKDAKYVGSKECIACHESTHGLLVAAYLKTLHYHAMTDAGAKPAAIVARFEADSPVKKADVKYVLGTGRVYQNYLDKDLKVLPGKWDANKKEWVAIDPADGATECVGCHTTNFDPKAKTWTELGVGCESCHGPGETHAESMEAEDIVNPRKLPGEKRSMVCGRCHAVGEDPTGKLAFSVTFLPGDDLAAHFKLKSPCPDAANSQYNDFTASEHAKTGTKCSTCHDSHGDKAKAEHQLNRPINEQCMACHSAKLKSLKDHAPSAGPKDSCATCHMVRASHRFEKPKAN